MYLHCDMRKFVLTIVLTVYSLGCSQAQNTAIVKNYTWKNRLILLFASQEDDSLLREQYTKLYSTESALVERDIVVFTILPDQVISHEETKGTKSADGLREQYQVGDEFCVILIGKDGSEKFRSSKVASTRKLFAIIDAMPMRQREARERKN